MTEVCFCVSGSVSSESGLTAQFSKCWGFSLHNRPDINTPILVSGKTCPGLKDVWVFDGESWAEVAQSTARQVSNEYGAFV